MADELVIGGVRLKSRLLIGTGKFSSKKIIRDVITASGSSVVTVALRRVDIDSEDENVLDYIPEGTILLSNTSGARTADEAVRMAKLAEASGCGKWIKIEVIPDNKYLLPDNEETLKAVKSLACEGFTVLPYMSPDLVSARKMVDAGAAAVMPLGACIGTNRGLRTKELIRIMVNEIGTVPVIVDAGIGKPSDAAQCMEMGCGAVLVNTAIAGSEDPVGMASAFKLAVEAGRISYLAGVPESEFKANPSSPLTGFLRG